MSGVFAGAMITIMALVVFGSVILLGGVNPILLSPAFCFTVLLAVLWAGKLLIAREVSWNKSPMHWPMLAFLGYSTFRYFTSPFEYEARNELFQIGLCGFVYFVASQQFSRRQERDAFLGVLLLLAVFQSAFGMWQAFTQSDAIFYWERPDQYHGRGSGTFVCPNHLAGFLELILGLLVARAAIVRRESQSIERAVILKVLTIYGAVMTVAGILVTLSRSGWAATIIGLSAFFFLGDWRPRLSLPRVAVVFGLLALIGIILCTVAPIRNYLARTFPIDDKAQTVSLSDPTMGGRTMMWSGSLKIIRDQPILGTGLGSWQWYFQRYKHPQLLSEPDYAHNDILQLAADYGLVGAAIMLGIFACFFAHALRVARDAESSEQRAFAVGAVVSVISILVHSWFDFNLHIPANSLLLAAIMGFTGALGGQRKDALNPPARPFARYAVGVAVLCVSALGIRFFVPTVLAYHYTAEGNSAKADLDFEAALAYFERASVLDSKYPRPHIKSGDIFLSSASWRKGPAKAGERRSLARKAIESYERALALNPYQAFVRVSKARAHELAGEDALALRSFQMAIEVAPVNAYAYFMLGCFYRERGEDDKALEAFTKANESYAYNDQMIGVNAWEAKEQRGSAQPR